MLAREPNDEKHTRGAIAAVQIPGKPDSAGSQFFIVVTDQPGLDGQFTVFARVAEGIAVAQRISETPVDEKGLATERVEIVKVTLRDRPPPEIPPFSTETRGGAPAVSRGARDLVRRDRSRALSRTRRRTTVRNFLTARRDRSLSGATPFTASCPDSSIQTGFLETRSEPPSERILKYVPKTLEPEFNDILHEPGVLSMARGDELNSASTSFFIVTGTATSLDHKYTAFGRVVDGMSVVKAIEAVPTTATSPSRVELSRVRVEKAPRSGAGNARRRLSRDPGPEGPIPSVSEVRAREPSAQSGGVGPPLIEERARTNRCSTSPSSAVAPPASPPPSNAGGRASPTRCSRRARSSTPSGGSRSTWCTSPLPSSWRSESSPSPAPEKSRRGSSRSSTTGGWWSTSESPSGCTRESSR